MTTEEKKPIEVQITEGPHWKKILTEIFPYGHEAKFTVRINQTEAKMFAKILAMGTGDSRYIQGIFLRLDKNFISCLRPALRPVSENCRIFFHGEYNKDAGKGAIRPYVLTYDKDSCSDFLFVWNQTKPQYLSETQIESMLNLQNRADDAEKKYSVGVADAQMAELKKFIVASPKGTDLTKKLLCWLLDQTKNLTEPVMMIFPDRFYNYGKHAINNLHDTLNPGYNGQFNRMLKNLESNLVFRLRDGQMLPFDEMHSDNDCGSILITRESLPTDERIIQTDEEIIAAIENYDLKIAAAAKPSATDEKIRNLKAAILANEQRISPFCQKVLLWLVDDSKFTMPSELIFSEEFGNFGKETYETFKDAGKDDIDSYQNVLGQLFADFPTDFSVTALLHSGINNKYSIRLAPPKAEEKLMHIKTIDAKLLNEIQGIPLK